MVYYAVGELGLDGGICVTASHNPKQYTGMKIVRPGALPVGGDSGLEDVRVGRTGRVRPGDAARRDHAARRLARLRRQGALVRRRRRDRAAEDRRRRRERHGGGDAATGARSAATGRGRPVLLRARRHLPEPRAKSAARGEPRVHRRRRRSRKGRRSASPTTGTPTAASSSTTRASSCPATSSPRCSPR